jgi:hypothetical protein
VQPQSAYSSSQKVEFHKDIRIEAKSAFFPWKWAFGERIGLEKRLFF